MERIPKNNPTFNERIDAEGRRVLERNKTGQLIKVRNTDGVTELRPEYVEYDDEKIYENAGLLNEEQEAALVEALGDLIKRDKDVTVELKKKTK